MAYRIALFNHKGGVSKTTTTFNLGWMLAEKGKRVILVDADPQCNLTGLLMGFRGVDELDNFYQEHPEQNLKAGLAPAFESRPILIKAVECLEVDKRPNLFLLPGHIGIAEYEVTLGIAQQLTGSIQALQNIPGSFSYLLDVTAEKYQTDYILIDTNPSLSSINQNITMTSDFFIVPTTPDYFSVMAINSLQKMLPRWHSWAINAQNMDLFREASYPLPQKTAKFLGYIVQNYTQRNQEPSRAFQTWIENLDKAINNELVPALENSGMLLSNDLYSNGDNPYCLAQIPNFQSLIASSQENQTPVFALGNEQLKRSATKSKKEMKIQGVALDVYQNMQQNFREIFEDLANDIIRKTAMSYARSH